MARPLTRAVDAQLPRTPLQREEPLIVRRRRLLVVAEVKARKSDAFGVPALAVTRAKQQRLRRLAAAWLAEHRVGRRLSLRFDVVAITGDQVDVYENAF